MARNHEIASVLCYIVLCPVLSDGIAYNIVCSFGLLIFSAAAELLNKTIITPADQVFTILLGPDVP